VQQGGALVIPNLEDAFSFFSEICGLSRWAGARQTQARVNRSDSPRSAKTRDDLTREARAIDALIGRAGPPTSC
jgi:hypothetical protein